jgi:hypothetical protein
MVVLLIVKYMNFLTGDGIIIVFCTFGFCTSHFDHCQVYELLIWIIVKYMNFSFGSLSMGLYELLIWIIVKYMNFLWLYFSLKKSLIVHHVATRFVCPDTTHVYFLVNFNLFFAWTSGRYELVLIVAIYTYFCA